MLRAALIGILAALAAPATAGAAELSLTGSVASRDGDLRTARVTVTNAGPDAAAGAIGVMLDFSPCAAEARSRRATRQAAQMRVREAGEFTCKQARRALRRCLRRRRDFKGYGCHRGNKPLDSLVAALLAPEGKLGTMHLYLRALTLLS